MFLVPNTLNIRAMPNSHDSKKRVSDSTIGVAPANGNPSSSIASLMCLALPDARNILFHAKHISKSQARQRAGNPLQLCRTDGLSASNSSAAGLYALLFGPQYQFISKE